MEMKEYSLSFSLSLSAAAARTVTTMSKFRVAELATGS